MNGFVVFGVIVLVVLGALYALRNIPGCTGDCEQGRKPCNCEKGKR